jgi:hypothetical protein
MGIDLNKMREKLGTLQSRGNGSGGSNFWRPQDGKQTIRILPATDGDPFPSYFFHYNVGKNSGFLCPSKNLGEPCPVCDFAKSLYREGDEGSVKMAKDLTARQRFFSAVLVRGEEREGPKVWGYGKKVYETLLNLVLNPDYGDITDADSGTDLDLAYGKPAGASFPQTNITPKRKTTPVCVDASDDECETLMAKIPELTGMFEQKTTAEVQVLLDEHLNPSDSSSEDAPGKDEVVVAGAAAAAATSTGSKSVDEAFSELFE